MLISYLDEWPTFLDSLNRKLIQSSLMRQYHELLQHVLDHGETRTDRTGTGTISVFGAQTRYDLREGFPCVTTKKLHLRSIIHELLWFLKGETNIAYLKENGVSIWDEWADEKGELGPVYGQQWRSWPAPDGTRIDQIARLIDALKTNPHSRRHLVSAWNVGLVDEMALPPCHLLFRLVGMRRGTLCTPLVTYICIRIIWSKQSSSSLASFVLYRR